jgi:hypothetical protein
MLRCHSVAVGNERDVLQCFLLIMHLKFRLLGPSTTGQQADCYKPPALLAPFEQNFAQDSGGNQALELAGHRLPVPNANSISRKDFRASNLSQQSYPSDCK